jgi:hypothetical protein
MTMQEPATGDESAIRSMTLLNETGDLTIAWEADDDERMREMIQAKMDQGYSFFAVRRKLGVRRKVRVTKASDLGSDRKVVLKDADAERLFREGTVGLVTGGQPNAEIETSGRVSDAAQAARQETVAVRPARGG